MRQELNRATEAHPESGVLKGGRDSHSRQGVGPNPRPNLHLYSLMGQGEMPCSSPRHCNQGNIGDRSFLLSKLL